MTADLICLMLIAFVLGIPSNWCNAEAKGVLTIVILVTILVLGLTGQPAIVIR